MCLMPYANNKDADQPEFIYQKFQDSRFSLLLSKSVCVFFSWSETPKDTFSHGVADLSLTFCWLSLGQPGDHLLGGSCSLGFPFVLICIRCLPICLRSIPK